ncbi:hypothetical protein C6503_23950 [Candidatus Poribacteria bacterium]|nr:MAG: hypothetical protein C6503_23950 [Candidatus Poribacteria bacterium]
MQEKKIRWKTSSLLFAIYLSLFIFLIGCEDSKSPVIPVVKFDSSDSIPEKSARLVAHIYFDATLSMRGFVVPGSTRYTQICYPYLESEIGNGWRDGVAKFFRFGEQVEPIDRDAYLKVRFTEFYEDTNIYGETFIEKIIDYEDRLIGRRMEPGSASNPSEDSSETEVNGAPDDSIEGIPPGEVVNEIREEHRLVVIVTDLFQDNSDIILLVNQLREKYIENGLEIGLFGLRSQFDGMVYDTGIGQAPLPHESDPNNPETFRPFYLLVLGRHADIAHYFDLLKANNPDAKTIIFSRYLVETLLSFAGPSFGDGPQIDLEKFNVFKQDPRLKHYQIVENSGPAKISVKQLKYDPLPHSMFFDSNTSNLFEPDIIAKHAPIGEIERDQNAENCLKITSMLLKENEDNELSVVFSLDWQSLPDNTVYLYEVTLRPGIDKYQAPTWCSDWDMGDERNGAKTLNLVHFVQGLSRATAHVHHPKIATFHCYIKKQ